MIKIIYKRKNNKNTKDLMNSQRAYLGLINNFNKGGKNVNIFLKRQEDYDFCISFLEKILLDKSLRTHIPKKIILVLNNILNQLYKRRIFTLTWNEFTGFKIFIEINIQNYIEEYNKLKISTNRFNIFKYFFYKYVVLSNFKDFIIQIKRLCFTLNNLNPYKLKGDQLHKI